MDLGAGRRGVDMGPSALRLAKLAPVLSGLGHTLADLGNVNSPVAESVESTDVLPYADVIADTCRETYTTLKALPRGGFPIALGGDHAHLDGHGGRGER